MIPATLGAAVERALGRRISGGARLTGGDIGEAYRIDMRGTSPIFVKRYPGSDSEMVCAEADGLRWLAEPGCIRIPEVLYVSEPQADVSFIALEFLSTGPRQIDYDESFGRALAELHRAGATEFGFASHGYIGRLLQSNSPRDTWAEFYRRERLFPLLRSACDSQSIGTSTRQKVEEIMTRLGELVGAPEPPARLHGDLWAGNQHVGPHGEPCLIDPAAYGGHREIDLSMMRLFGGYSERVFAAYNEAFPLSNGHAGRVPLYQLYPLLAHVNLFGSSYARAVEDAAIRALSA